MRLKTKVREVMTPTPISALPDATIASVARLMAETNCGEIPICREGKVVGIITDRDITCRTIGRGLDPALAKAKDIMTRLPVTVFADDPLRKAIEVMEQETVRRVPVVDSQGRLVGILSQVDVAMRASRRKAGEMLAQVRTTPPREV